jgi:PBP1b-binding outer membrane lipoprotein LpoB
MKKLLVVLLLMFLLEGCSGDTSPPEPNTHVTTHTSSSSYDNDYDGVDASVQASIDMMMMSVATQ